MKYYRYISLVIAALLYLPTYAQGNLQFNRVINLEYNGVQTNSVSNYYMTFVSNTIVVPPGKVLKLETAGCRLTRTNDPWISGFYYNSSFTHLLINNILIAQELSGAGEPSFIPEKNMGFPIWLNTGSYQVKLVGYIASVNSYTAYGWISAIEFNILP